MSNDKAFIKSKIAEFLELPVTDMQDDRPVMSLVSDSFMMVEMVIEMQEEFKVRLVQNDFKDIHTIGELIELIDSRRHSGVASVG